MSSELSWHTGFPGELILLHVEWFDENGVDHRTDVEVGILERDKPRTLEVKINGVSVGVIERT